MKGNTVEPGQTMLVSGGSELLGSLLCERLLRDVLGVLGLDNLFTGNQRNIEGLIGKRGFELMRHDATFPL